jgi:hypothetical protein
VGLVAVCWVGVGYVGTSPLALTMTAIIGTVYVVGAVELLRFNRATATLARALASIPDNLPSLGDWLDTLPPSMQNAVRLRIEGERVGLPGPALTPYLVGLLVLLGMLGTFLGMVVTLNGAVIALESTTDLQTIRASLAAPVKGLGVAFGTSVAGVAASAMLGLVSALGRRERLLTAQILDVRIATALRGFSLAHQRQETFKALQLQARILPDVVDKLQAMMVQMDRQSQQLSDRLLANQESHYREAKGIYEALASSVDQSLKHSLTESARMAGATIQPVVEATMSGIARETTSLHARMADTVKAQLDGVSERFGATVTTVSDTWTAALARHERTGDALHAKLQDVLQTYADTFEQRSAALLATVDRTHTALQADLAGAVTGIARDTGALHEKLADRLETRLDGLSNRFGVAAAKLVDAWTEALGKQARSGEALAGQMQQSLESVADTFAQRSSALLATVKEAHAALQAELATADRQRLTTLTQAVESMAASLQREWQAAGERTLAQQERICRTLEETARDLSAQAQTQASSTIDEVSRLMESAAEAPRAAADVIAALRQELSASIARDNALLEERSRIMETLGALLDAINHASSEQRGAIDALVASSTALLERSSARFEASVEAESAKLTDVASRIASGAVEVSSLSEAFGFSVQLFSESNEKLMETLQRIEDSLNKSVARSDEQLAYYVAQAREVIDLSILSQKQIVEDLQRLSGKPALVAGEA